MSAIFSRLRTVQTPRLSLVLLLLGLAGQTLARSRMMSASSGSAVAVASLDSAIIAAQPAPGDTSGRNDERLRSLVARRRDTEVEARHAANPWFYTFLLGGGLVLAAVVTGALALIAHLRGEA